MGNTFQKIANDIKRPIFEPSAGNFTRKSVQPFAAGLSPSVQPWADQSKKIFLQKILRDYYEVIQYTLHPRVVEMGSFNRWCEMILLSFGYDPLQCPDCNKKMT